MTILHVANAAWLYRQMNVLLRDLWSLLPVEVSATAEAHPIKALITLCVLILVAARVAMAVRASSIALIAARVLLTAGGLFVLMELEVLAMITAGFSMLTNASRRVSAEF